MQGLLAQQADSSHIAPRLALDLVIGGGGGGPALDVEVRTAADRLQTVDMSGSFTLAAALEHRIRGRWSGRAQLGWMAVDRESNGRGGDPYASPRPIGDRWYLDLGAAWQVLRTKRSQFSLSGVARGMCGMDINVDYVQGSAFAPSAQIDQAHFFYRPAVVPHADVAWRYRGTKAMLGFVLRVGCEYEHFTCERVALSPGLAMLPDDLRPLTGARSGWAYTVMLGITGWE